LKCYQKRNNNRTIEQNNNIKNLYFCITKVFEFEKLKLIIYITGISFVKKNDERIKMLRDKPKTQILLILFVLTSSFIFAQKQIKFEYISLPEGLSQSSVLAIHKDEQSYMWFATYDGLNRFNGYEIEIFRNNSEDPFSILDNSITCIYESKDNKIWIGHKQAGISVYNKLTLKFSRIKRGANSKNSLINDDVKTITGDKYGNIWVGTSAGLSKIEYKETENAKLNYKFSNFKNDSTNIFSLKNNDINKIIFGKDNYLWLATSKGVCKMDLKNNKFYELENQKFPNKTENSVVRDILFEKDSILWIGTEDGLGKYFLKNRIFQTFTYDITNVNSLSDNFINCLALDLDNTLWIGTNDGLNHFNSKTNKFEIHKSSIWGLDGLNSSVIFSLFIDEESILWVGTSLGGINKWNRPAKEFQVIKNIPFDNKSLSSNKIRAFYQTPDSLIWIGTVDAGMSVWNKKENSFTHYKPSIITANAISDKHIRGFAEDKAGRMWLATDENGIDLFDRKTQTFRHFNSKNTNLANDEIWAILVDSKNRLWVGSFGGLFMADLTNFTSQLNFTPFVHSDKDTTSISDNMISVIIEDAKSRIWVGTRDHGVSRLNSDQKTFKRYNLLPKNSDANELDRIYSIIEDSEKTIWVGTRGSLCKYNPKKDNFIHFGADEYKFPNPIMMGIVDDGQNIWVSTNRGLAVFNKKKETVRNYDVSDGLQSNEFMIGAYIRTFDGQILFGGQTGFNAFYPNKISDNPHQPNVLLTKFLLFNKNVNFDTSLVAKAEINLKYSENTFTFEFVGLDYVNSLQNKYAYKLEGFDEEWQNVGTRRFASYTNISPGKYRFKVIATNNDGLWSAEKIIKITIEPPFWLTWWFLFIAFSIVMGIIYFIVHMRDVYRDKSELEVKVQERTLEVVAQSEAIKEQNEELQQQQEEISAQRDELERQRDISEERRIALMDSITYAERIQRAILPPSEIIKNKIPEHFIFYKPRDIVSGDYYWMTNKGDKLIITAADCTGHGVPGAFLSMLGVSFLNEIVGKQEVLEASVILGRLREKLIESLHQTGEENESKDGMDLALCVIDNKKMQLQYAGAYNPLFLYRKNKNAENGREFIEIKADRMPVGISDRGKNLFKNNVLDIKKGDAIYMFSDGYADQFGGPENKKFKIKNFKTLLYNNFDKPMLVQEQILQDNLAEWQLHYEQIDDILVMGIRI